MNDTDESVYDELQYSTEYADYIILNCHDQRVIANGADLLQAMEDGLLFVEFLAAR